MGRSWWDDLGLWRHYIAQLQPSATDKPDVQAAQAQRSDQEAWQDYTQSVTPLPTRDRVPQNVPPLAAAPVSFFDPVRSSSGPSGARPGRPPYHLDLHQMNQEEAYQALQSFLQSAAAYRFKYVLVITGKGHAAPSVSAPGIAPMPAGILHRMLPRWLQEGPLRLYVNRVIQAPPEKGGAGAFIIYLRRG